MTHSPFRSMPAVTAAVLLTLAGCKKNSAPSSDNQVTSLLFDAASPEAREALATPVNFRLTDANYAQWEQAQGFLDALPRSAFASASGAGGNAIDRAVATLQASPRARTAIERTGLTVRDFVLETVALAQAAEAGTGKPPGGVTVPPENVQFVQRYQSRIMQARAQARATRARMGTYSEADTTSIGADIRTSDSASVGDRARAADSVRREGQEGNRPNPPADTTRDTVPSGSSMQAPTSDH